jgi:hypothetical protein
MGCFKSKPIEEKTVDPLTPTKPVSEAAAGTKEGVVAEKAGIDAGKAGAAEGAAAEKAGVAEGAKYEKMYKMMNLRSL